MVSIYVMTDRAAIAAEELKRWRVDRGITQRELARLLGCKMQAVSNIETRRVLPELRMAIAIEDVAGIPARSWVRQTWKVA